MSFVVEKNLIGELLKGFADQTVMGIYGITVDGTIKYANNGFCELFGFEYGEIYDRNLFEFIHPDDVSTVQQNITTSLDHYVQDGKYEIKGIKKDQSIVQLGVHGHVTNMVNEKTLILGTMVDITKPQQIKTELMNTAQNFESLIQASPLAIVALDHQMNVKLWNRSAERMFGWTEAEIMNQYFPIIPEAEQERFANMFAYIMKGNSLTNVETKRKTKHGEVIDVSISTSIWNDSDGNNKGYMAIFQDITSRKLFENELSTAVKKLKDFQYALDASTTVSITDRDGKIIYVNENFCDVSKYSKEELIGEDHRLVNSGYHPKELFEDMWSTITQGKVWNGEVRNRAKDGQIWWANATIVPFLDDEKKPYQYMAIRKDITDRKRMEEELHKQKQKVEHMAYFDYLTGLPNRRSFELELKQKLDDAKANQKMLGLMFLDLDGFKFINDTLGHEVGDKLLREVAQRLNQTRRNTDFLSRLGGDEFTIIISDINEMDVIHEIAQQLLALFEHPFLIDSYELYITTSMGISLYPYGAESMHALIQNADLAMYRAKDEGKNKYEIFSPTMNVGTYKKFSLQNDLRKAVQEKQEIFILFQPKVNSKTNTIQGVEALARWKHPEWGVVAPEEFISLAEQTGLINTIGEHVLFLACQQNKKWQDEGFPPIQIAVNFSPLQFLQADIVDTVKKVLEQTGLEPKWLEIEITETAVIKNEAGTLSKLAQLREMGISIAVDDFGTGFSSLSYLKKIKPNTVKIDQSFVQEIPADTENTEIVTAVIKLADRLKMNVVAEGVETSEQASYLRKIHCNQLQGFYFSQPISKEDFERLLAKGSCLPHSGIKDDNSYENRRSYFRIDLASPLIAEMTITSIGGKVVKLGMTKALIEDIGPGGVRFTANINLPTRPDLIIKIRTYILEQTVEVTGPIVWSKQAEDGQQYGLQFNIDDKERDSLTSLLNQFQVKYRNSNASATSSFLKTSRQEFFHPKNKAN